MRSNRPFAPSIALDRSSSTPLHQQISEPLSRLIQAGKLVAGTLIENEVSMARRLDVSRPTARRAMQTLVEEGLLIRKRGRGTVVAPKPLHRRMRVSSLNDELQSAGKHPTTEILRYNLRPATTDMARKLDIAIGADVVEIERLRYREGIPIAVLYNWLPAAYAPAYVDLQERGLYELLRERGMNIASTTQIVTATPPRRRIARLLEITKTTPVLTIERTGFGSAGEIIEWGLHTYRGDMYRYESTVFASAETSR